MENRKFQARDGVILGRNRKKYTIRSTTHKGTRNAAKEGFVAFNKILIGKTRGPRLGYFLSNMSMDKLRERLEFVLGK